MTASRFDRHRLTAGVCAAGIFLAACGGAAPPAASPAAPTPAAPPAPTAEPPAATPPPAPAAASGASFWESTFDTVEGWHDNNTSNTYNATISSVAGGTAKVTEAGPDKWGKVAFMIKGVDFSRGPKLEIAVTAVDPSTAWKVSVVPEPWNDAEHKVLINSQTAVGAQSADMAEKTGWSGVKDVNLILIIEGESTSATFDSVKITYTK